MPRRCCVPGCRSNYNESDTSTFLFPKETSRRDQWTNAINRRDFTPTMSSVVCVNHFSKEFVLMEDRLTRSDGTVLIVQRDRPGLTKDAYPSIFPNQSKYLSREPPTKCSLVMEPSTKFDLPMEPPTMCSLAREPSIKFEAREPPAKCNLAREPPTKRKSSYERETCVVACDETVLQNGHTEDQIDTFSRWPWIDSEYAVIKKDVLHALVGAVVCKKCHSTHLSVNFPKPCEILLQCEECKEQLYNSAPNRSNENTSPLTSAVTYKGIILKALEEEKLENDRLIAADNVYEKFEGNLSAEDKLLSEEKLEGRRLNAEDVLEVLIEENLEDNVSSEDKSSKGDEECSEHSSFRARVQMVKTDAMMYEKIIGKALEEEHLEENKLNIDEVFIKEEKLEENEREEEMEDNYYIIEAKRVKVEIIENINRSAKESVEEDELQDIDLNVEDSSVSDEMVFH